MSRCLSKGLSHSKRQLPRVDNFILTSSPTHVPGECSLSRVSSYFSLFIWSAILKHSFLQIQNAICLQTLILASPKFCLVSMTQPDLLLFSILNLAKNYINRLKKKKTSHWLFGWVVALDFLFDVPDVRLESLQLWSSHTILHGRKLSSCPSFLPIGLFQCFPSGYLGPLASCPLLCGSDPSTHSHRLECRLEYQACVSLMEQFHTKWGVGLMCKTLPLGLKAQIIISHVFSSHSNTIFSQLSSIIRIWDFPRIVFTLGFK